MITQKEIARRLGISRTTVARALNGSKSIKEETKKRVLELAKEMNYEKNIIGSALGRTKTVYCFIVKSKNQFYTSEITRGLKEVNEEYKAYGYNIKIIETEIGDPEKQIVELEKILKRKDIDGIIITPLKTEKIFKILKPHLERIRVVSLGIKLDKSISHIGPNYIKQGKIAGGIMKAVLRDRERLLILDNGNDKISSKKYLEGFLKEMKNSYVEVIGPIVSNGIDRSVEVIKEMAEQIDGIYINRYAQDIYKKLPENILKDKKIVTTGISKEIRELIKKRVVIATVMEEIALEGYLSGKVMFDYLYRGEVKAKELEGLKPHIIFLENLN